MNTNLTVHFTVVCHVVGHPQHRFHLCCGDPSRMSSYELRRDDIGRVGNPLKLAAVDGLTTNIRAVYDTLAAERGFGPLAWDTVQITEIRTTRDQIVFGWNAVDQLPAGTRPAGEPLADANLIALTQRCRERAGMPEEISKEALTAAADTIEGLRTERAALTDQVAAAAEEIGAYRLSYTFVDDPDWIKRLVEGGTIERQQLAAWLGYEPRHLDLNQKVWDFGKAKTARPDA